jgi:transcription antitermination factor NusG
MNWFVLYVKTRQELKIQNYLKSSNLNIEVFCPTRIEVKQWSDRKKKIKRPLLPSILFVKTTEENRDSVFSIPGCIRYLFEFGKPAIVKDFEIERLVAITDNKRVIEHEVTAVVKGSEIDLTPYGFKDVKGIVDRVSNTVCWVALDTLGCMLKLTLK